MFGGRGCISLSSGWLIRYTFLTRLSLAAATLYPEEIKPLILPALCITPPYSFVTQEYNTWDTVMPAPFAIVARPCISNGNNQGDSPIRQMWQWSLPPGTPLCECRVHGLGGFGKER